jgi:hypothetical protein
MSLTAALYSCVVHRVAKQASHAGQYTVDDECAVIPAFACMHFFAAAFAAHIALAVSKH